MDDELVEVYTCGGGLEAETLRLFLESRGMRVMVSQESAGSAYSLTVGALGRAHIYVLARQAQAARDLLAAMEKGEYIADSSEEGLSTGKRRWKKKVTKKNQLS